MKAIATITVVVVVVATMIKITFLTYSSTLWRVHIGLKIHVLYSWNVFCRDDPVGNYSDFGLDNEVIF